MTEAWHLLKLIIALMLTLIPMLMTILRRVAASLVLRLALLQVLVPSLTSMMEVAAVRWSLLLMMMMVMMMMQV